VPWLQGITAEDLDIAFENGKHFAAVQEMTEEFRQEIAYQGAFGTDGPVLRRIRSAEEGTLNFTAILLKEGATAKMNDESVLKTLRDFDVQVVRGTEVRTYAGCNWSRIAIRSTLDQVTLDCDVSVPGYVAPSGSS
jgi:hypothetical protein